MDKFRDFKNLGMTKRNEIYRHSWKTRAKIGITAKFGRLALYRGYYMGVRRYEFYLQVVKTIFHFTDEKYSLIKLTSAQNLRKLSVSLGSLTPFGTSSTKLVLIRMGNLVTERHFKNGLRTKNKFSSHNLI